MFGPVPERSAVPPRRPGGPPRLEGACVLNQHQGRHHQLLRHPVVELVGNQAAFMSRHAANVAAMACTRSGCCWARSQSSVRSASRLKSSHGPSLPETSFHCPSRTARQPEVAQNRACGRRAGRLSDRQQAPARQRQHLAAVELAGYATPATSRQVAMMSVMWPSSCVIAPGFVITPGHQAINGVEMPPS